MNIRARLSLIFFCLVTVFLTLICVSIYYFSSNYRYTDFYRRLKNRALNTARLLTEVKEVNPELLRRMEHNNPASLPNQYILIYDKEGEQLYTSAGQNYIPVDAELLQRIRDEKEYHFQFGNYEAIGFVADNKKTFPFTIVAAATDLYGMDALRNLRSVLFAIFFSSIVIISFLGWFYAGRALRPISKIVQEVSNISEANLNERVAVENGRDELGKLAITFNRMLGRLQSAFIAQKNFIANASHEIKTPLTKMSAEIEVSLLQQRDPQQYVNVLRSVLDGLKGLDKLSTQLLLLAQTTSGQPGHFRSVRVDDVLWEAKEELMRVHPDFDIEILLDLTLKHESLVIHGDEQLIKVVILNLIDNACKYSDDHHVTITMTSAFNKVVIEFVNTGRGIDESALKNIFEPFVRATEGKKVKGSGIGLSLVRNIITLHKGDIFVESAPHRLTRFTVHFPIQKSRAEV
jgi:signal transduction histidine kinase